jgi:hypothetical protein
LSRWWGLASRLRCGLASECLGSEQCISHCNPDVGWDLDRKGLFGAPPVRVLVGAERHDTVDRAFGLWALTSPTLREALDGIELADSWATDAHNTLNVPYDCGVGIVAQPSVIRSTFGVHASYLIVVDDVQGDPSEKVPKCAPRFGEQLVN